MENIKNVAQTVDSTVGKVQEIVNTVKDISQTESGAIQSDPVASDMTTDSSSVVGAPMIGKSTTTAVMWTVIIFTFVVLLLAVVSVIVFNKDISVIVTQSLGYTGTVTLGCLAKKGFENVATTKYTNKQ